MSEETLAILLEIVSGMSVPVGLPDAEVKVAQLVRARTELSAELSAVRAALSPVLRSVGPAPATTPSEDGVSPGAPE